MAANITLQNISEKTGFSVVTVSRALSGQKGVSEETRSQIRKAAGLLGYHSQDTGQTRHTGRTSTTIGVIAPERFLSAHESLYWSLYQELTRRLAQKKLFGLLEIVSMEKEKNQIPPSVLDNPDVGGVIILGTFAREYAATLERITPVPVVFLDAKSPSGRYDSVISNSYMGGFEMVNHLLDEGHRDIGYVGTLLLTDSIDDRFMGGQKALMQRGLAFEKARIYEDRDRVRQKVSADRILLDADNLPTAFFCNSDLTAGLLINKLQAMGIRVPEDVSVAGFDDYPLDPLMQDFITSYDINMTEMVKKAVHVITHRMMNEDYRNGLSITQGSFVPHKSTRRIGEPVPYL